MGDAGTREQPLGEGRTSGQFFGVEKKGPPGCTVRITVNLHVSGSATEVSARIVIVASTGRASDIFHDLGRVALSEGPQVLERVDPGTVAVVPAERDGVIASAGDRAWGHVRQHALWIEERPAAHFLDAADARACQSKVPDVEVVTVPVLPEHRQRARISPAESVGKDTRSPSGKTTNAPGGPLCTIGRLWARSRSRYRLVPATNSMSNGSSFTPTSLRLPKRASAGEIVSGLQCTRVSSTRDRALDRQPACPTSVLLPSSVQRACR